ncbi:hypothetical protein Y032_0492g2418 [Ancylostoma ceylanicum]|nr:hypothetical protein Y032_0492g2418 [Ancylostoma ceylanicum]
MVSREQLLVDEGGRHARATVWLYLEFPRAVICAKGKSMEQSKWLSFPKDVLGVPDLLERRSHRRECFSHRLRAESDCATRKETK